MQVDTTSPQERFSELMKGDHRFHPEAYSFVFEALDFTVRSLHGDRKKESVANQHISGPQLLDGIREYALETFGCLTLTVFHSWGIRDSSDFGEIVFNLIDHGLMGKQDTDRKEDFADGFGGAPFDDVFQVKPVIEYNRERDEWKTSYESVVYG